MDFDMQNGAYKFAISESVITQALLAIVALKCSSKTSEILEFLNELLQFLSDTNLVG